MRPIQSLVNIKAAVDIVPTMAHLANSRMPSNVEGGVIWQALEGFEEEKF